MTASSNALKTGTYSSLVVLPNESIEDFQKLANEFFLSLSPRGIVEESIVQDLVAITWRKMRLDGLQRAGEERILTKPLKAADLRGEFWVKDEYDWLIQDVDVLTEEFYRQSIAHLQFINRLSDYGISKDDFCALPKTHPSLYELIVDLALAEFDYIDEPNPSPEQLMRARDEMGRAFSKGLAELRKQQQWRLNMAIDVTPPKQG